MPELPEVETVCRGLIPFVEGRRLVRVQAMRADLRRPFPPDFDARLNGRRVEKITRRAKYMIWLLDDGEALLTHLGMSGAMVVETPPVPPIGKHDHVIFDLEGGNRVVFRDPRRFGLMDLTRANRLAKHPSLASLGPEPLGRAFNAKSLKSALEKRRQPIKTALLDQKLVAGLGNIYVCEALFMARINPFRLACSLSGAECKRLAAAVRDVLTRAIAAGGSSLRDHRRPDGELGYFQHNFLVYDQEGEPCPVCGDLSGVKRVAQAGRSTYYCPCCQPYPAGTPDKP